MGHLINPIAFRLGHNVDWKSTWTVPGNNLYRKYLHSDLLLYRFLEIFFNKYTIPGFTSTSVRKGAYEIKKGKHLSGKHNILRNPFIVDKVFFSHVKIKRGYYLRIVCYLFDANLENYRPKGYKVKVVNSTWEFAYRFLSKQMFYKRSFNPYNPFSISKIPDMYLEHLNEKSDFREIFVNRWKYMPFKILNKILIDEEDKEDKEEKILNIKYKNNEALKKKLERYKGIIENEFDQRDHIRSSLKLYEKTPKYYHRIEGAKENLYRTKPFQFDKYCNNTLLPELYSLIEKYRKNEFKIKVDRDVLNCEKNKQIDFVLGTTILNYYLKIKEILYRQYIQGVDQIDISYDLKKTMIKVALYKGYANLYTEELKEKIKEKLKKKKIKEKLKKKFKPELKKKLKPELKIKVKKEKKENKGRHLFATLFKILNKEKGEIEKEKLSDIEIDNYWKNVEEEVNKDIKIEDEKLKDIKMEKFFKMINKIKKVKKEKWLLDLLEKFGKKENKKIKVKKENKKIKVKKENKKIKDNNKVIELLLFNKWNFDQKKKLENRYKLFFFNSFFFFREETYVMTLDNFKFAGGKNRFFLIKILLKSIKLWVNLDKRKQIFYIILLRNLLISLLLNVEVKKKKKKIYPPFSLFRLINLLTYKEYNYKYLDIYKYIIYYCFKFFIYSKSSNIIRLSILDIDRTNNVDIIYKGFGVFHITANLVVNYIISHLKNYFKIFEVMGPLIREIKNRALVKSYRIQVVGRLTRKERAWYYVRQTTGIGMSSKDVKIDYAQDHISLRFGAIGVKVWFVYNEPNRFSKKRFFYKITFKYNK